MVKGQTQGPKRHEGRYCKREDGWPKEAGWALQHPMLQQGFFSNNRLKDVLRRKEVTEQERPGRTRNDMISVSLDSCWSPWEF
jgi:hypothetical protein